MYKDKLIEYIFENCLDDDLLAIVELLTIKELENFIKKHC
jgi:hypothetical protein